MSRWIRLAVCSALLAGCGTEAPDEPAPAATRARPRCLFRAADGESAGPALHPGDAAAGPTPDPGAPVTPPPAARGTPPAPPPVAMPPANPAPTTPPLPGDPPYGCTKCTRLFNGVDLENWETNPGAWVVKDGVLASTGKSPGELYTKEDLGDYRIFFQVRHVGVMPGARITSLAPRCSDGGPATPRREVRDQWSAVSAAQRLLLELRRRAGRSCASAARIFDDKQWHQCEVLVKEAGSFRAACCPVGDTACKTVDVLSWKGTGRKHPFNIQVHNAGLLDEYKEIWIEQDPTGDELLSQK